MALQPLTAGNRQLQPQMCASGPRRQDLTLRMTQADFKHVRAVTLQLVNDQFHAVTLGLKGEASRNSQLKAMACSRNNQASISNSQKRPVPPVRPFGSA